MRQALSVANAFRTCFALALLILAAGGAEGAGGDAVKPATVQQASQEASGPEGPRPLKEAIATLLAPLAPGQTMAILQFTDSAGQNSRLSQEVRQRVEPLLIRQGSEQGLKFLERGDLKLVMEEWKLDMSGLVKRDGGAMNLLGADLILTARLSLEPSRLLYAFKITRLEDGQIVAVGEGWQPVEPIFLEWGGRKSGTEKKPAATPVALSPRHKATSDDGALRLWANAPRYRVGERMTLFFEVARPLHVRIVDVTPAGEQTILFPNPFQSDDLCRPGQVYRIPPDGAAFALEVTGPTGKDRIKALASAEPLPQPLPPGTRGVAFTQELLRVAPTRAMITFDIIP